MWLQTGQSVHFHADIWSPIGRSTAWPGVVTGYPAERMRCPIGTLWLARLGPAAVWLAITAAQVSCSGTEGTLLVRHDQPSASSGAPSEPGDSSGATPTPYVPAPDERFFVQLDGAVDITQKADWFYLDADQQTAGDLAALKAPGRHYLCYLSAGSNCRSFRDDAQDFPDRVIGRPLADFPQEHWLDVRDPTVRELMAQRVTALAASGCDGVPPSSLAVHVADTGFDLTVTDALDYARWLAERIHAAGMSAGLTAPADMTSELWPTFDFGLGIDCVSSTGCQEYAVFEQAKKTVLHIEVGDSAAALGLCKSAQALGFDALISDPAFAGQCVACRDIL